MGTMMSDPRPVEVRTGMRARIVVAEVMRAGRILLMAPSSVASLTSSTVVVGRAAKLARKEYYPEITFGLEDVVTRSAVLPGTPDFVTLRERSIFIYMRLSQRRMKPWGSLSRRSRPGSEAPWT